MPDDFEDYVTAPTKPRRSDRTVYQPPDADWSLNRLPELQDFYTSTYKRPLPISVKGQGTIHNKWGLDHRASADLGVNPSSAEGQALMGRMRETGIPFLAFNQAIPGVATGPHIHVGRPSSHTGARYGVGAQVKKSAKAQPTPDDFDSYVGADTASSTDDFDAYVSEPAATPTPTPRPPRGSAALKGARAQGAVVPPSNAPSIGGLRMADEAAIAAQARPTSIGELRRTDEPKVARLKRIAVQVAQDRNAATTALRTDPGSALARTYDPRADPTEEVLKRYTDETATEARMARREQDEPEVQRLTQQYRSAIKSSGALSGEQWTGETLARGAAGLTEALAAVVRPQLDPNLDSAAVADRLNLHAEAMQRAAVEEGADRTTASRIPQEIIGGLIGSAPELAAMYAGVPPIAAFGAGGGLRSYGRGESAPQVTREAIKQGAVGAAFELPFGRNISNAFTRAAARAGTVGAGTAAVELASGADLPTSLRAGAMNALVATAPEVLRSPPEMAERVQAAERALKTPPSESTPDHPATEETTNVPIQPLSPPSASLAAPSSDIPAPPQAAPVDARSAIQQQIDRIDTDLAARRAQGESLGTTEPVNLAAIRELESARTELASRLPAEPAPPSLRELMARRAEAGPPEMAPAEPAPPPVTNVLTGTEAPPPPKAQAGAVNLTEIRDALASGALKLDDAVDRLRGEFPDRPESELRAMLAAPAREEHHATIQPRDEVGQFIPGTPGGPEAQQSLLRTAAKEYQRDYSALHEHQARRLGLDIANEDVSANYFARLRRFTATHKPGAQATVDQAERLFTQGKYTEATRLAESALSGTHDYPNALNAGVLAGEMSRAGLPPPTNWKEIVQEVRRRMGRTGGLSGGGSTFYDVNKYPEGGRADHEKIAYILEPVIDGLRADATRLLTAGKLKATDWTTHIRTEVNKILQSSDFSDWHPLNKSAALGVLVDKLKGGPAAPTPSTGGPEPTPRPASLPKTLARAGRETGTTTEYPLAPNAQTKANVESAMHEMGPEAFEAWYRTAPPSAERSYGYQALADHYQLEAAKSTDPTTAQSLRARAVELANFEIDRSYTLGQAVQAYAMHNKYLPSSVVQEAVKLAKRAGRTVSDTEVAGLTKAAREYQTADKDMQAAWTDLTKVREGELVSVGAKPAAGGGGGLRTRPSPKVREKERTYDEAAERRREAKKYIASRLAALEQSQTALGYWRRTMNITRGLMVSAFQTAMRNLQSQVVRFNVERAVDLAEHTIRTTIGLDSDFTTRSIWRASKQQFDLRAKERATTIAGEHPAELARLFNTHAEGMDTVPLSPETASRTEKVFRKVEHAVELANFANRVQENHLRAAEFLAELDLHLRRDHNLSLNQFVRTNGIDAIPQDIIRKAVNKALEVTFADSPARDSLGGPLIAEMIKFGNYLPPTLSPVAFPRFMYNNLKFLYQHNPTGLLDIAYTAGRNAKIRSEIARLRADTSLSESARTSAVQKAEARLGNVPRAVARTLLGSAMFLTGLGFRRSDHAGEKWYELKIGGHTLDTRPFGPFSTYLFLGELVRRAVAGERSFTSRELADTFGFSAGPSGSATEVVSNLYDNVSGFITSWAHGDDPERYWTKIQKFLKSEGGEFGRAVFTPIRQVKDLVAAFDASEAITRDTGNARLIGPALESVPYASQAAGLPPAHLPTTATPLHQEHPALKALSGWRVETPKTFIEHQLDELHIPTGEVRANTGNPTIDELEKRLMGPRMDDLGTALQSDSKFLASPPAVRRYLLKEMMKDIREEVREQGEAEQPDIYRNYREQRKPRDQRELEKAVGGSPGLSSALRLGVPVPIPAKRSTEDDLAYRARLLQVGRAQRAKLDEVVGNSGFSGLSVSQQRNLLHDAVFS